MFLDNKYFSLKKVSFPFPPYFYVAVENGTEKEVMTYLNKKFSKIKSIEILKKEDLDLVMLWQTYRLQTVLNSCHHANFVKYKVYIQLLHLH